MAAREDDAQAKKAPEEGANQAAEEQTGEAGGEEAAEKGPSTLAALLVPDALVRMGVGILVLAGMTAGAFFLITDVIGPSLGPVDVDGVRGTATDADVPPLAEPPGDQYTIQDIVINPAGTRGKRFLRLGIALESKDGPKVLEELETRRAQVRDMLIRQFTSRTLDELSDPTVREEVRLSCIEELNATLIGGKISNIYFTDYVLQ